MTKKTFVPVTEEQKYKRVLMTGLGAAVGFLLAGQVLMLAVLPAFPLYGGTILNAALICNLLVIPSVGVLVYGAVKRYFARF